MDCVSFSSSTTTATFSASIPFSKNMLCTQNLGRVSSRGTSLRGSRSSLISLAHYEDIMVGSSLSGQAFAHRCYQENYKGLSTLVSQTSEHNRALGSWSKDAIEFTKWGAVKGMTATQPRQSFFYLSWPPCIWQLIMKLDAVKS